MLCRAGPGAGWQQPLHQTTSANQTDDTVYLWWNSPRSATGWSLQAMVLVKLGAELPCVALSLERATSPSEHVFQHHGCLKVHLRNILPVFAYDCDREHCGTAACVHKRMASSTRGSIREEHPATNIQGQRPMHLSLRYSSRLARLLSRAVAKMRARTQTSGGMPSRGWDICLKASPASSCIQIGGRLRPGCTPRVVAITDLTHSIRCLRLRCSNTMFTFGASNCDSFSTENNGNIISHLYACQQYAYRRL